MQRLPRLLAMFAVACVAGSLVTGTASASVDNPAQGTPTIDVVPNPAHPGDEVTITGQCGGAGEVKSIFTPNGKPFAGAAQIVNPNPNGFVARAKIDERIGSGAGPVYVDCGSDYGETMLVIQP